jgi:hypothetical protein
LDADVKDAIAGQVALASMAKAAVSGCPQTFVHVRLFIRAGPYAFAIKPQVFQPHKY